MSAERTSSNIFSRTASKAREAAALAREHYFQANARQITLLIGVSAPAVFGAVACGGDSGGVKAEFVTPTPAPAVKVEGQTPTNAPTVKPTEVVLPTPTPKAEVIKPVSDLITIKTGLADVYKLKSVPQGSCPVETINAFADQIFALQQVNPNKFTLAGQIATIYAELSVFAKNGGGVPAEDLAKSLRAGVEVLIEQHLQERGLPATNKPGLVTAWEQNVARKIEVIESGSGCSIVIEQAK